LPRGSGLLSNLVPNQNRFQNPGGKLQAVPLESAGRPSIEALCGQSHSNLKQELKSKRIPLRRRWAAA
jgi:hypothetical protein